MSTVVCPTCGAQNDSMNRFCDQCGTRLESPAPAAQPPAQTEVPTEPVTVTSLTCSNCGSSVLLGQAFCEECGFPLGDAYTEYTSSDMPTLVAPPPLTVENDTRSAVNAPATSSEPEPPADADTTVVMPPAHAGTPGVPAETPETTETPAPPPAEPGDSPTLPVVGTVPAATPVPTPAPDAGPAPTPAPDAGPAPTPAPDAEPAPTPAPDAEPAPDAGPAPTPAPDAGPAPAPAPADIERQRLGDLVEAHRDTIAQYEQMLARYPANAAPAFLTAGLDEARQALARAEADLEALTNRVDPAEVARLESIVAAHRDTLGQYEQMLARYPTGAAPAFLTAGLDEARQALAQAETDLAALRGETPGTPAPAPSGAAETSADAAAAEMPAVPAPEPSVVETQIIPPAEAAPAPTAAPVAPRLVLVNGGEELTLPADKNEVTVGREDPVSQIYPEIDLTPYGGEAGGVSRQHARISRQNGQWTIIDLDSTNYTRVDGHKIDPHTPTPIQNGSHIQFGRIATIFQM